MEAENITRPRGRPSKYAAEFVRDITVQVLIAFYNDRQNTLRNHIKRDPEYVSKLRDKAQFTDSITQSWLEALDYMTFHFPKNNPTYRRELMFRQWCLRLQPPCPPDTLDANPDREQHLRKLIEPHLTDEYYRINCKRWLDAIERVRTDKNLTLKIPPTVDPDDDGDDFL